MKKLFLTITILALFSACQNEELKRENDYLTDYNFAVSKKDELHIKFAKTLASAIADSPDLRRLIRDESLKQFDKDYDVLYQLIKDKVIGDVTVGELLSSYASSTEEMLAIEEGSPLLTIFVPVLPEFSAESWDADNEIPPVAVRILDHKDVPYFDALGRLAIIPSGLIPGFPIIVIKENERVVLKQGANSKSGRTSDYFDFIDESFDPQRDKTELTREAFANNIDPVNIEAFNLGMEWHRDYVYYGLTPTNTTGAYKNNYSEFITSFQLVPTEGTTWYSKISDQTGDPTIRFVKPNENSPSWTDGFFEFKVEVLINDASGTGSVLTKFFPARGDQLADITYRRQHFSWIITSITSKKFNPNLELVPWDLQRYGTSWKFIISEVDPSETYQFSESVSTTFATNFEVSSGSIFKLGLKLGGSLSTNKSSSVTRTIQLNSDQLGETILTFDQPIITSVKNTSSGPIYTTREVSSGWYTISVEPKKIF